VTGPPPEIEAIHHIGITVASVDETLTFWKAFLGVEPRWRQIIDGPYLPDITGYPGIKIDASVIDLPGGIVLEILDYQITDKSPNDMATAKPGNVHICLRVTDIEGVWQRAIDSGATPTSPGPVEITVGPNQGARACYLRDPNGITIELFQLPPN